VEPRNVIIHEHLEVDYEKMYQAIKGPRNIARRFIEWTATLK